MPNYEVKPTDLTLYDTGRLPMFWMLAGGPGKVFPGDSGDVPDLIGNGPAGTRTGNVGWGTGLFGPCLNFGGAGYVRWPTSLKVPISYPTLMFWYCPATAVVGAIFDTAPAAANTLRSLPSSYNSVLDWHNASPYIAVPQVAGVWQHVAAVFRYTAGTRYIDLYYNGVYVSTATGSTSAAFAWNTFTLGTYNTGNAYYTGLLDDFRVYPFALTSSEIAQEYNDPFWRFRPPVSPANRAFSASTTYFISPASIPTAERWAPASLSASASIAPAPIPTAELWAPTSIAAAATVSPSTIATAETWGAASVAAAASLNPAAIASVESWGPASLAVSASINPASIPTGELWGAASLAASASLTPAAIATAEQWGPTSIAANAVIIAMPWSVAPGSIPTAEQWGPVSLSAAAAINPASIPTAERWGPVSFAATAIVVTPSPVLTVDPAIWLLLSTPVYAAPSPPITVIASREDDIYAAIIARLSLIDSATIDAFEPGGPDVTSADFHAITVMPGDVDYLDDVDPIEVVVRGKYTLDIEVREEDPATRHRALDLLTSQVMNSLNSQCFANLTLPPLTLIRKRTTPKPGNPTGKVTLSGEWAYLSDPQDFDETE